MKKAIIFILLGLLALLAFLMWRSGVVLASQNNNGNGHIEACFCHNLPHNPHTICTDNQALINAHSFHVRIGFDSLGECPAPEPVFHSECRENACVQVEGEGDNLCEVDNDCVPETEDQCENLEGVQEEVPSGMGQEKTEEGLICLPLPVPTPEPPQERGLTPAGVPTCTADPLQYAPTVTKALKTEATGCAAIEWSTTDANRYNVFVGPSGKNPQDYWSAVDVHGQSFNFCGLPKGVVDIQVCGVNVCGALKCSAVVVDELQ